MTWGLPDHVIFSADQIERRVAELGREVSRDYRDRDLVLIGVLYGSLLFFADLLRRLDVPVDVDVICAGTYGASTTPGECRVHYGGKLDLAGRDVLLVEDIVDTGRTLGYILRALRKRSPKTLEICALLHKRKEEAADIPIRYVGFPSPSAFLVGYGMDHRGRFRGLPWIGSIGDVGDTGNDASLGGRSAGLPGRHAKDGDS